MYSLNTPLLPVTLSSTEQVGLQLNSSHKLSVVCEQLMEGFETQRQASEVLFLLCSASSARLRGSHSLRQARTGIAEYFEDTYHSPCLSIVCTFDTRGLSARGLEGAAYWQTLMRGQREVRGAVLMPLVLACASPGPEPLLSPTLGVPPMTKAGLARLAWSGGARYVCHTSS